MSDALAALKAAIAADKEADDKLVAYLADIKTKLEDVSAQLEALKSRDVISADDVQAIADELNAHAADVGAHIPAEPAPAVDPAPAA